MKRMALEKELAEAVRKQLGRHFVSLVLIGSEATGDALPDSDVDAFAFKHGKKRQIDLAALEKKYGVRIGVAVRPMSFLKKRSSLPFVLAFAAGRARTIAGHDIKKLVPPVATLLKRDYTFTLREDYVAATRKDSRANVLRREPRRHVGFIIAICESLLLSKGVAVRKAELPAAMKRHHPRFRIIPLLKRALWRRKHWKKASANKRQIAAIRRDVKKFLKEYRRYVYGHRLSLWGQSS